MKNADGNGGKKETFVLVSRPENRKRSGSKKELRCQIVTLKYANLNF